MSPTRVAHVFSPSIDSRPSVSTIHDESATISSSNPGALGSSTISSCSSRTDTSTAIAVYDDIEQEKTWPLSTFRLWMAHIGLALTLFLATTDATIVSTSLPTITSDLPTSENQYTWVGVAYMLTQTASQPLYGRVSDLVGRKTILYSSMTIFVVGSLLCGAAQNITWLIISRAFAGIGGGGIVNSVWVITSEIVEVRSRAKWSQALSVTWSCSAIAGPLLGGLFSSGSSAALSWRWAFYLNIPVCFFALLVLLISLRNLDLGRSKDASWRALGQKFDFCGLGLFMAGTSSIVVGFSFATDNGWISASTLSLIILGIVVLICGGFYEGRTKREALFPPTVFSNITTVVILVITFLHNVAFTAGTFYLALYFQAANGSTPLQAGILMLPYSLGSSLASMPAAWFIGFWQDRARNTSGQKLIISLGLMVSTLGFGLLNLLRERSPTSLQTVFPLLAGVGLGMLFHAPYQIFTRALRPQELATGTSAFFLVRFTGATIGLAVAGAVFSGRLSHCLPSDYQLEGSGSTIDWKSLAYIEPIALRWTVLDAVSSSIQTVWMFCTPCLGVAFMISLFLKNLSIEEGEDLTASGEKSSPTTEPAHAQV